MLSKTRLKPGPQTLRTILARCGTGARPLCLGGGATPASDWICRIRPTRSAGLEPTWRPTSRPSLRVGERGREQACVTRRICRLDTCHTTQDGGLEAWVCRLPLVFSFLFSFGFVCQALPGSSFSERSRPMLPSFLRAHMTLVMIFTHVPH